MVGAILKATDSSFQKGMTFCRSLYVNKVMKLLTFIFEQPSYSTTQAVSNKGCLHSLCWGVSLKQSVTCVTISNKGNVV